MNRDSENGLAIQTAASNVELIEGLQRALDRKYRDLLKTARTDWERLFGGKDPSDACVSVRIHDEPILGRGDARPGSGFLKPRKNKESGPKEGLPRFAH